MINKKIFWTENLILISILISILSIISSLAILSSNALAQNILVNNSNETLNYLIISIDSSPLVLAQNTSTNYTVGEIYYEINDYVTNTVFYNCSLSGLLQNFSSNLSGVLNQSVMYHQINVTISDGIYVVILSCDYNIMINHTLLNNSLNITNNQTNSYNYTYLETYNESLTTQKEFIVDTIKPGINYAIIGLVLNDSLVNGSFIDNSFMNSSVLFNANNSILNGSIVQGVIQANTLINLSYFNGVFLNLSVIEMNDFYCNISSTSNFIILNNTLFNALLNSLINQSNISVSNIIANSTISNNTELNRYYNYVLYFINQSSNYEITCIDLLNNTEYGEIQILLDNKSDYASNSSNLSSNTPFLNITLNKQNFNLGEIGYITINANNYSNVTLTICPQQQGWVQCYLIPTFVNETFPKVQAMPYSNKTGKYIIEAVMHYGNFTILANVSFNVINTLQAQISSTKKIAAINEIITFNATASGGIGEYSYLWIMHDGQKFYGKGAYKNYTTIGEFTERLFVNDSQGNSYNTSINVEIRPKYTLKVIISDEKTGSRMKDVLVEVGDYNLTTNSAGEASFVLMKSKYDVYASKEGYGSVVKDVTLDSDVTLYINMTFEDFNPPEITLLTQNNAVFKEGDVKLKFKANDIGKLRCELYIVEGNDSWFILKDYGDNLLVNTEYTFELTDLLSGDYRWRIDCIDDNGNKGESEEYSFIVSSENVAKNIAINDDVNFEINRALDKLNTYSGPAAEIAEALKVKQLLKELLEKSNNLDRDIHNVAFRRDLDETGKKELQEKIVNDLKNLKNSIPEDIKITSSRTFIKYVKDKDLQELLKEYSSLKNLNIDSKAFFESTKRMQNKIVISTSTSNAILYYPDGTSKEITFISKDVSVSSPSYEEELKKSGVTLVEIIPKEIAPDVKNINIINKEYVVLKSDPLLEFPSTTKKISYFINKTISLSDIEKVDTVIINKNINSLSSTTGFSIVSVDSLREIDGKIAMIIIIVILLIIYFASSFDIFTKISRLFSNTKKRIAYIRVLVNDALDYLAAKDYDNAALLYREIRLNYESAPDAVKKEVYQECYDLCNALDSYYFNQLLEEFESYIKSQLRDKALLVYQKMEKTFEKFDEKNRKDYDIVIKESFNKLNIK